MNYLQNNKRHIIAKVLLWLMAIELTIYPHAGLAQNATDGIISTDLAEIQRWVDEDGNDMSCAAPLEESDVQALPEIGPRKAKWKRTVVVTAYSSTVDQTDDTPFITANGTMVRDGIIAANFLRFGTKVRFPSLYGEKVFDVTDRMHERFSDRVDIWMETREEAVQFGVKRVEIEVL